MSRLKKEITVVSLFAFFGIMCLSLTLDCEASTKGCVYVYEDGTEKCFPAQIGADCTNGGATVTINGKKVVRGYQVLTCPGYDGLGRKKSNSYINNDVASDMTQESEECFDLMEKCASRCGRGKTFIDKNSREGKCITNCLRQKGCDW